MTMPWSALYGHPASGIRPSMHNGLWPLCMVCACMLCLYSYCVSSLLGVSVRSAGMLHGIIVRSTMYLGTIHSLGVE